MNGRLSHGRGGFGMYYNVPNVGYVTSWNGRHYPVQDKSWDAGGRYYSWKKKQRLKHSSIRSLRGRRGRG